MEEYELKKLCRNFCHYYKPLKNEEIKCRGYLVVRELINKGKDLCFDKTDTILDEGTVMMLSEKLCPACSFYDNDCDFAAHIEAAPPCGGFIFLGHLLKNGITEIDDIIGLDILFVNNDQGGKMAKFSIREVIEQAVQTEKLGAEFYAIMALKFEKDKGLKRLFRTLEAKEHLHEKTFADLKNRIKDDGAEGWEEVSQYLRAIVESAFFLGQGKSLGSLKNVRTVINAVDYALGFEKETLLYYIGIRDSLKSKKILNEIIKEERSHIIWLNKFRKTLG